MNASFALLGLLDREPSYGYDLKKDYDRLFSKDKPLAFGQVYAGLSRLTRDNLASAIGLESGGGPDRKRYKITTNGKDRLYDWLATPETPQLKLQTTLFIKTVLALLLDKNADAFLDAQRTAHIKRMRELTKVRQSGDISQTLLADHALFHLEADLRWIDMTAARLSQLAKKVS